MGSHSPASPWIKREEKRKKKVYPHKGAPMGLQICAYKSLIYLSVSRFLLYCLLLICSPFVSAVPAFLFLSPRFISQFPSHHQPLSPVSQDASSENQKSSSSSAKCWNLRREMQMQCSEITAAHTANTTEYFVLPLTNCPHVLSSVV